MKDKYTVKEFEVLEVITKHTKDQLDNYPNSNLGLTAQEISEIVYADRSNVSRIMNRIHKQGDLIKLLGRPTLFLSKKELLKIYDKDYIPTTFASPEEFDTYLSDKMIKRKSLESDPFDNIIGYMEGDSLFQIIKKLKNSVFYPPYGLPIIMKGEAGTGKRLLSDTLFDYGLTKEIFKSESDFIYIDCQNTPDINLERVISDSWVNKRMIVLDNFEYLKDNCFSYLYACITNQMSNSSSLTKIINAQFVLLTTSLESTPLHTLVPTIIELPRLETRTVKERLAMTIDLFQKEVDAISRSISLSRNVIHCFSMSHFKNNCYGLSKEIKSAIANAYSHSSKTILEITIDDLSDEVLENTMDLTNKFSELNRLNSLINLDNVNLLPNHINSTYKTLVHNVVNEGTLILKKDDLDHTSPLESAVKNSIQEARLNRVPYIFNEDMNSIKNILFDLNDIQYLKSDNRFFQQLIIEIDKCLKTEHDDEDYSDYNYNNPLLINQIKKGLKETFTYNVEPIVLVHIDLYITMTQSIINHDNVAILFVMSNEETSKNLTLFANNIINNKISYYYSKNDTSSRNILNHKSEDFNKGILILTDSDLSHDVTSSIEKLTKTIDVIRAEDINTIHGILQLANDPFVFIEDITRSYSDFEKEDLQLENENIDLKDLIYENVLKTSLVFLNPTKILDSAMNCFESIIKDLNMVTNDIVAIKFLTHLAFAVERVVRHETINYSRTTPFIKKYNHILMIVEKNLQTINQQYGITIPQDELIYISRIFIDEYESSFQVIENLN